MRIIRIELKNIKSYRDAVVDLQGGVIAIRGHNGAGKSTLLEAIGWALFDSLPYTQENFVREGERSGKVTVRFLDAKDNREYEVVRRCGNGATWFVLDPETGVRIDSAADVQAFLREHMRIDGSVAIKDLFTSAIGVPQGSLTADFLMTPANRKKRFDALLQVEDYGAAAVKLNDTVNHIKRLKDVQDNAIENLERDVARLEDARAQLSASRDRARALEATRARQEAEAEVIEARRKVLLEAQTQVALREGDTREADARFQAARQRVERAVESLDEARAAAGVVRATQADHDRYLRAERARAAATDRQRARDELRAREADASRQQATAEANVRNARQRLDDVARAEREIVALQDDANRQTELERTRDAARQNVERKSEAERASARIAESLAALAATIKGREREVAAAEAARTEAQALPERKRHVEALQAATAIREQRERRRAAIAEERKRNAARHDKAKQDEARQRTNVTKLEDAAPIAKRKDELIARETAAKEAMTEAEGRLAQSRRSRELAGVGNCPFLEEPCLNIQKRGENSLRGWFDKRIVEEERALAPLAAALKSASAAADDSRTKATYYDRLGEYQDLLEQARAALDDCKATQARLEAEDADLATELKRAGDMAGLAEAQRLLEASQQADKQLATLAGLRRELDEARGRQERDIAERDRLASLIASLAGTAGTLRAAEEALAALGDPRGRITGLRARANERAVNERALGAATGALTRAQAELAAIASALEPFATLDAEIAALEATIGQTRGAHADYMRNEQVAGQLPARERERATATQVEADATGEAQAARAALDKARAAFDADELQRANQRASALSHERGETREALRNASEAIKELEEELRRGQESVAALEAARVELDELAAMEKTLQQFRDLIKEAGPQVTRALLSQISTQANAIFGDIIGDRGGVLAWENDYEITFRRDGQMRTFAQLSGGEQMSAALAVRLALLRRLTRLDMAFFDEPTQNMDGERRSALAEQLRRVRGFDQLMVISHDDTFEQGLDGVIHLEKHDGATRVASGEEVYASASPIEDDVSALAL